MQNSLVVYFSATGTTRAAAEKIAQVVSGDLFELRPAEPYSAADLDWNDPQSRSSQEMNQESARPALAPDTQLPDQSQYQTLWIGFPIWWGEAPRLINRFLESVTLGHQPVILFATSGSSGIDKAAKRLQDYFKEEQVIGRRRLSSDCSLEELSDWIQSLGIQH